MSGKIEKQPKKPVTQLESSRGGTGGGNKKTAVGTADSDHIPGIFSGSEQHQYECACRLLQVTVNADFEVKSKAFRYLADKHYEDNSVLWEKVLEAWKVVCEHNQTYIDVNPFAQSREPRIHTFYALLQVIPEAECGVIRQAYDCLQRKYHPDNISTGNAEKFKSLEEAWLVLSFKENRAQYDRLLQQSVG